MIHTNVRRKFDPVFRLEEFSSVGDSWTDSEWQEKNSTGPGERWDLQTPYARSLVSELESKTNRSKDYLRFLENQPQYDVRKHSQTEAVSVCTTRLIHTAPMCFDPDQTISDPMVSQKILLTSFNHPSECTLEALETCAALSEKGFILSNRSTLLKGINDDVEVIKDLNLKLLMMRVRPYVLFSECPLSEKLGLLTSSTKGVEILEGLRGWTSGLAVPHHVNRRTGLAQVPNYIRSHEDGTYVFRNYRNQEFRFQER